MESTATPNEEVTDEDEELVEKCLEIIRQENAPRPPPNAVSGSATLRGADR
jgi:hypothetical protein